MIISYLKFINGENELKQIEVKDRKYKHFHTAQELLDKPLEASR